MAAVLSMAGTLNPADGINFDNLISFTQTKQARITDHPVEFGVDVSDHAQVLPIELVFQVQVTRSPLFLPSPSSVELVTQWFERNLGKQVNVIAPAGIFGGFVLSRFSYDETVGQRVFSVTVREVRIALAVSVPIPPRLPNPAAANGLASAADAGVQPPTPVPPPPPASVAAAIKALAAAAL